MNALNSLIIEGHIVDVDVNEKNIIFTIDTSRTYKDSKGQEITDHYEFKVLCFMVEHKQWFTRGRGVRIVGRLKQNKWFDEKWHSEVIIVAEHIEFKPTVSKQVSD